MTKLSKIFPKFIIIPFILIVAIHILAFYGTRLINTEWVHYTPETAIDRVIPLCTAFFIIYFIAYAQWVITGFLLLRENRENCCRVASIELITTIIALICFLVFPTSMQRPEITGDCLGDIIGRFIYASDSPDNLFPSLHCTASWICFRGSLRSKAYGKWFAPANGILAILVFASVVFVKQHLFVDIISAVVIVELVIFCTDKFRLDRGISKIIEKIMHA